MHIIFINLRNSFPYQISSHKPGELIGKRISGPFSPTNSHEEPLIFSLFTNVSYVKNLPEIETQKLLITNFSKSDIAKGVDVNRAVNEED
jgi:hypothetical protein